MAIPVSDINKTRVLREIWLNPGVSRIGIASALGLNKSSITKITQELLDSNMVITGDEGIPGPQGGRKPVSLELNPDWGVFAGIEITESSLEISCIDFSGKEVAFLEKERTTDIANLSETAAYAVDILRKETWNKKILGLGIGVPGMVDCNAGTILRSIPLKIQSDYDLTKELTNLIPCPVFIENDANCCCWGEIITNKEPSGNDFLYVLGESREHLKGDGTFIPGPGIGMGLALDNKVYHGPGFGAGEFKSILNKGDSECQFSLSKEEMARFFSDPAIRTQVMEELGRNVALIANVLNLNKIVMGGFFHSFEKEWFKLMDSEIYKNHSYPETRKISTVPSIFGKGAVSMGAAYLVIENFFNLSGRFDAKFIFKEKLDEIRTF
ncbi:MAG: ROK family transcriptional regulator [Spirochaetales bacterium]|nr:ROK family transcriptional regulator [Spirochaetales bacterium]